MEFLEETTSKATESVRQVGHWLPSVVTCLSAIAGLPLFHPTVKPTATCKIPV